MTKRKPDVLLALSAVVAMVPGWPAGVPDAAAMTKASPAAALPVLRDVVIPVRSGETVARAQRRKIEELAVRFIRGLDQRQFESDWKRLIAAEVNSGRLRSEQDVRAYLAALEESLKTVGDDAQLANMDLQQHFEHAQALLALMSKIMKMANETAMAIIRNIK